MASIRELILYEDDSILIVNKPCGLPSQSDSTHDKDLLTLAGEYCQADLHSINRLDRPASGIVAFAKSVRDYNALMGSWRDGTVVKEYLAVVEGKWKMETTTLKHRIKKGRGNKAIIHKDGKESILKVEVHPIFDNYSLCRIHLQTGRFHQIRLQMSESGHPIKGDIKYGARRKNKDRCIHLHAYKLKIKDISVTAPLPGHDNLWKTASEYYNKSLS